MIKAYIIEDKITSTSPEAFSSFELSYIGEKKNKRIEYSILEALYLLSENKLTLNSGKKEITFEKLIKKAKKYDKKVATKLIVFSDLKKKGYVIKTALKFGAEFRVYEKGSKPGEQHAKWILFTSREHESINWHEFAAKNRVAHTTNKNLLMAIVDDEEDITYYEISWIMP